MVLPAHARARPGGPQKKPRQLVSQMLHRAGQRTGHQRRLLLAPRRYAGRISRNRAMVLENHPVRDQLLDDLKQLEGSWPDRVITMQRNWIGKSIGARVKFAIADAADIPAIEVFTTRIDTIYGATAIILAPAHPLVDKLLRNSAAQEHAAPHLAKMR